MSSHSHCDSWPRPPQQSTHACGAPRATDQMRGTTLVSSVSTTVPKGSTTLQLVMPCQGPAKIAPGDWVRLVVNDTASGDVMAGALYDGKLPSKASVGYGARGGKNIIRLTARVVSFDAASGAVQLSRAVPWALPAAWGAQLHK